MQSHHIMAAVPPDHSTPPLPLPLPLPLPVPLPQLTEEKKALEPPSPIDTAKQPQSRDAAQVELTSPASAAITSASDFTPPPTLAAFLAAGQSAPVFVGFGSMVIDDLKGLLTIFLEAAALAGVRLIWQNGWSKVSESEFRALAKAAQERAEVTTHARAQLSVQKSRIASQQQQALSQSGIFISATKSRSLDDEGRGEGDDDDLAVSTSWKGTTYGSRYSPQPGQKSSHHVSDRKRSDVQTVKCGVTSPPGYMDTAVRLLGNIVGTGKKSDQNTDRELNVARDRGGDCVSNGNSVIVGYEGQHRDETQRQRLSVGVTPAGNATTFIGAGSSGEVIEEIDEEGLDDLPFEDDDELDGDGYDDGSTGGDGAREGRDMPAAARPQGNVLEIPRHWIAERDACLIDACPHTWLFPHVAAVVHHGGAGTTSAGLMAGKPTWVCPFFGDQHFWWVVEGFTVFHRLLSPGLSARSIDTLHSIRHQHSNSLVH